MLCQKRTILNQDLGKELKIGLYNLRGGEHGAQASKAVRSVSRTIIRVLQIFWGHIHFKGFIARIRLQIQVFFEFYNWNKVLVKYCEGGAFTGDVEYVDHATNLHFRGARIFEAVIEDVLEKGLKNAKNAILAGCSAGGYPTMLYFDRFRSLLSNTPRVKCLVDAGYFIHSKNPKQAKGFEDIFNSLITLHVLTTVEPHLPDLIENGTLTASQKKTLREFRPEFLSTLPKSNNPQLRGVFIDSVNHHTSLLIRWSPENATVINNLSLPKAFADWYFDRKYWYVIDEHDLPIPKSLEHDKQVPQKQRRNGIRRIIFMQEVNVHICNV